MKLPFIFLFLISYSALADVTRIFCQESSESFSVDRLSGVNFQISYIKNNKQTKLGDDIQCVFADSQNLLFSCSVGGSKVWSLIRYTEPKSLEVQILGFEGSEVLHFSNINYCRVE